MSALGSPLETAVRAAPSDADPARALHEAVEAIARVAERAAGAGVLDAPRRRQLVSQSAEVLSTIIRRGVEAGTFRPPCARWAVERLPYAIVAGLYARALFDLPEERSLRAGAAADAALELLCSRVVATRDEPA
jgi:hypothetical protein